MVANLICTLIAAVFSVGLVRAYRKQQAVKQVRRRLGLDKKPC